MSVDIYTATSAVLFMTLLATLNISVRGFPQKGEPPNWNWLTHPTWLAPLAVVLPFVIGSYLKGKLSPWPPAAFMATEAGAGLWAGVTAFLATLIVDLWLLWTATSALQAFVPHAHRELTKYYRAVNVLAGGFILAKAFIALP